MNSHENTSDITITGEINKKVYNVNKLRKKYPSWDDKSKQEKIDATHTISPINSETVYNVTTDRFHQYLVDNINPTVTNSDANLSVLWIAISDGESGGTSSSDTELNNPVLFQDDELQYAENDTGDKLTVTAFVGAQEAQGTTLNELGLFTGNPANTGQSGVFMINHATFDDVVKGSDEDSVITFEVTLSFNNV